MKKTKLILGIISFVLAMLILLQSCAAGLSNSLENNGEAGGSAGLLLALMLIVSGIIVIIGRNDNGKGIIVAGILNIVGGLLGFLLAGSYGDLNIWSALAIIFGIVYIIPTVKARKKENNSNIPNNSKENEEE